jgi:hypothetical protein
MSKVFNIPLTTVPVPTTKVFVQPASGWIDISRFRVVEVDILAGDSFVAGPPSAGLRIETSVSGQSTDIWDFDANWVAAAPDAHKRFVLEATSPKTRGGFLRCHVLPFFP